MRRATLTGAMQAMVHRFRKPAFLGFAAAAALGLLLSACNVPVEQTRFPELSYSYLPPIRLAVGRIEVVQQYKPPDRPPHVEQLFPVRPAQAARTWIHDRLKATGGPGVLRAIITQASVVAVPLKEKGGLTGLFTNQQSTRYDGELGIRLEIKAAGATASVSSLATRRHTIAEDASVADREKVWFHMTEAMMNDLNASLQRQIKENFGRWLTN